LRDNETAVIEVARALCHALAYAHEQGIVHRDVKPENVLFDKLNRPLLADFGIALSNAGSNRVTREGNTPGSAAYMSPEQARGHAIDGRSDLYSLGVVCHECLAGKLPFSGEDSLAVALAHLEQPIPRLPPAHRHWQSFLDKAMAKNADERFQTATEMLDALEAIEKRMAIMAPIAAVATSLAGVPERIERSLPAPMRSLSKRTIAGAVCVAAIGAAVLAYALRTPTPGVPPVIETAAAPPPAAVAEVSPQAAPPQQSVATPAEPDAAEPPPAAPPDSKSEPNSIRDDGGPEMIPISLTLALGQHEVTRGEYAQFARASGRGAASCRKPLQPWSALEKLSWSDPGFAQNDRHPVVCVSWSDANAYAQWLRQRTGQRYRLPSTAEWLQAARQQVEGGNACARGNVADVSLGSFLRVASRYKCSDGFAQTAPVGHFAPNQLGIVDLLGNVSEWTRDCAPGSHCEEHVFRGSSWHDGPDRGNLEISGSIKNDIGYTTVGFRLARELDKTP
jgi:formylglycine-generating enzyme required for sulfatase activity